MRTCRRQTECQEEYPSSSFFPVSSLLPLSRPPGLHWQKQLQADWDSSLGKKAYFRSPSLTWGRGREKGMKPWANWHKPQLIEWSYRTYRAILLKKKEGCTSKTGFLEGMSVRKISLKTFPLFLCFAWQGQYKMHTPKISFNLARNSHLKRQTDFFFSKRNCILISYFVQLSRCKIFCLLC